MDDKTCSGKDLGGQLMQVMAWLLASLTGPQQRPSLRINRLPLFVRTIFYQSYDIWLVDTFTLCAMLSGMACL